MTFLAPAFLWTLALAVPCAAVYLLKVRPRRYPTTAFFLWERVDVERRATRLLHRLRDAISLALLLAALVAAAFAAAGARVDRPDARDALVVIDGSVSMRSGGRFDRALAAARAELRAATVASRAALATLDKELRVHAYMTRSLRELSRALDKVAPTELPSDVNRLEPLGALSGDDDGIRVIVITDDPDAVHDVLPSAEVRVPDASRAAGNAGLTAADLRRLPSGDVALLLRVSSSLSEPRTVNAVLSREDVPVRVFELSLEPGGEETVRAVLPLEPGRYTARLEIEDDLRDDNTARLVLSEDDPLPVSVHASEPYFFDLAVRAFESSDRRLRAAGLDDRPAVAIARAGAATPDGVPRLVFGVTGGEALGAIVPGVKTPDHPALRYLDAESLRFPGARNAEPPPDALVLIEDDAGTPLLWSVREVTPEIRVNLDPSRGSFYLSPQFPLLIHGAVTELAGRRAEIPATIATGERLTLPGLREGERGELRRDDPAAEALPEPLVTRHDQPVRLTEAAFYRHSAPSGTRGLSASVLHPAETCQAGRLAAAPDESRSPGTPLWRLLILAALAVLVLEEALYQRRVVG